MKIDIQQLFLRDVYYYDIEACHYQIIKKFGLDISHLDKEDKEQRNIQIGKMMKDNPRLTKALRNITNSTISEYLSRNNISDSEVITRQYDGFITTRKLYKINLDPIPIKEYSYQILLISSTRDRYVASDGKNSILKGIPNRYKEIDKYLSSLLKLNFMNKTSIFKNLEKLKNDILSSDNWRLFFIDQGNDYGNIVFKKFGQLSIAKNVARLMDLEDINKEWYFNYYIRPFTEAIVMEFS